MSKKLLIILLGIFTPILFAIAMLAGSFNSLVIERENVHNANAKIETVLQRKDT